MRNIRIIGVLIVGLLLSLGACAGPATSAKGIPAPAADTEAQIVNAPAPAPVQTPVPVQTPIPEPVPVAVTATPVPVAAPAPVVAPAPVAVPVPAGATVLALSDLTITPSTINPGNDVIVTVKVTNPGQQAGTDRFTLNLVMDGEACPSFVPVTDEVNPAGGSSQILTFKLNMGPGTSGSYTVIVGQLTGSMIVQ